MTHLTTAHESSLLLTLEEISRLVSHCHDPRETLTNIVRLIQDRFQTDVCSVYLLEPERAELVLGATVGLQQASVGRVRMRLDEGLTGMVAEKLAPVMVDDAFSHPRFKYFPEAGEDPYHSFLGVPLVEGGTLQGVLVVQTTGRRTFSSNECRMLVTVGSQLAPLVSEARLLEQILTAVHEPAVRAGTDGPHGPISWTGTPLSPGVGLGHVHVVDGLQDWQTQTELGDRTTAVEEQRLANAIRGAHEEIARLSQQISTLVGEDHGAILQAQLMILQDRTIEQDLIACIAAGATAEAALYQTLQKYVAAFQKMSSSFFQERVYDVKDVFRRIFWHLRPSTSQASATPERVVLVAHEASVMDFFSVDLDRLAAVVVENGGPQSHAAILARSLHVPMVGQALECVDRLKRGGQLLVNGSTGVVILEPTAALIAAQEAPGHPAVVPMPRRPAPDLSLPGFPRVEANINLLCEVSQAAEQQAAGVGLYRSEFLFLARRTPPTEEEQVGIYGKLLEKLHGRPVSIRTFDLRPDKLEHYSHMTSSSVHPFDWRRVLDSPPVQHLFKEQVRAILRAAALGPTRILVPLVTRTEQLDFVLNTVGAARAELRQEGLEFADNVPLGIMIEVAAAVPLVGPWARHVDFFALGTNDLVASALGIDRDDPVGSSPNDVLHPGVLRILRDVVMAAHVADRPVTVCGEMASDPEGVLALAALGVDAVSVAVHQLSAVRSILAARCGMALAALEDELLSRPQADQVRELLRMSGLHAALNAG